MYKKQQVKRFWKGFQYHYTPKKSIMQVFLEKFPNFFEFFCFLLKMPFQKPPFLTV